MPESPTERAAEPLLQAREMTPATPVAQKPGRSSAVDHGGVYDQFRSILAASGGQEPPPEQFSPLFRQAEFAHPVNEAQKARVLGGLQQQFGNRYIQRVLSSSSLTPAGSLLRQPIQRQAASATPENTAPLQPQIDRSGGQPLDEPTRAFMGSRFGYDFNDVRVHTDSPAQRAAKSLDAEAFATGRDIYFSQGAYDPASEKGRGLLAHELTHVVQQGQGMVNASPRGFHLGHPEDPSERQAEAVSKSLMRGETFPALASSPSPVVQRRPREASTPAGDSSAPGAGTASRTPTAPKAGDFPINFAGMTIGLPIKDLLDRAVPGSKLSVPDKYLNKVKIPKFKLTEASLDLDENKMPTGATVGVALDIPPVSGRGNLTVDKSGEASGAVHIEFSSRKIPGLRDTTVDAEVKRDEFNFEANVGFDLPKVTGNLNYKFENQKHSGKGKARYEGAKMKGEVEVILSEAGQISGSGMLEMELFKGLRGTVNVAVDEKRNIQVKGKLEVPGQIELFPEKKYEKSFFSFEKKFPLWGITIPVIDVNVGIFAEIHAGAGFRSKFGPGVLRNIALTGEFGTDPEAATEFGLGGEFFVPAAAEVVANVGGGIGLGLAIADITGGIEAVGVAGLYTALTVRPNFRYAGGKYTISGMAELAGVAQLKFGINAFAKIDVGVWLFKGTVWRKDWTLAEWIWNTGLNVALRANISYTLGDDFAPDISFETGKVDPEAFIKDVMPESGSPVTAPPKPPAPDRASFTAEGTAGQQAPGAAPGAAPAPPTPGAPAAATQPGTPGGVPPGAPGVEAAPVEREVEVSEGEVEVEETAATRPAGAAPIQRQAISGSMPEDKRIALAATGYNVASQSDPSEVEAAQVQEAVHRDAPLPKITTHPPSSSAINRHPIPHADDEYPIWWPAPLWKGVAHEGQKVTRTASGGMRGAFKKMRDEMRRSGTVPKGKHVHHVLPLSLGGQNADANFQVLEPGPHMDWHRTLRTSQEHARHDTGAIERINPEQTPEIGKKFVIYMGEDKKEKAKQPKKPEE